MRLHLFLILPFLLLPSCITQHNLKQANNIGPKIQEQFLLACQNQNLPELHNLIKIHAQSIDIDKPLSSASGENCLLFLTAIENLEGISLLLKNGANPYYKSNNESALLIALKNKNIFKQNLGNYQFRLIREILQYADYNKMPEVLKYIRQAKEEPLPTEAAKFPIRLRTVFLTRPSLLLSFLTKELETYKEVDRCKVLEPQRYIEARKKITPFYYNDNLQYRVSPKFIPLEKLRITHALGCPTTIEKIDRRVTEIKEIKTKNKFSFQEYQELAPSWGPIVVFSYKNGLAAVMDGNGRTCALKKIYNKDTLIEVLFVDLTDKNQQKEFDKIIDDIRETANFYGFTENFCLRDNK